MINIDNGINNYDNGNNSNNIIISNIISENRINSNTGNNYNNKHIAIIKNFG